MMPSELNGSDPEVKPNDTSSCGHGFLLFAISPSGVMTGYAQQNGLLHLSCLSGLHQPRNHG
jgi:hypothetical protein